MILFASGIVLILSSFAFAVAFAVVDTTKAHVVVSSVFALVIVSVLGIWINGQRINGEEETLVYDSVNLAKTNRSTVEFTYVDENNKIDTKRCSINRIIVDETVDHPYIVHTFTNPDPNWDIVIRHSYEFYIPSLDYVDGVYELSMNE